MGNVNVCKEKQLSGRKKGRKKNGCKRARNCSTLPR